jgi:hypothetical protein
VKIYDATLVNSKLLILYTIFTVQYLQEEKVSAAPVGREQVRPAPREEKYINIAPSVEHHCAAKAFYSCPAIISRRPESQDTSKEPQLNPEEESRII